MTINLNFMKLDTFTHSDVLGTKIGEIQRRKAEFAANNSPHDRVEFGMKLDDGSRISGGVKEYGPVKTSFYLTSSKPLRGDYTYTFDSKGKCTGRLILKIDVEGDDYHEGKAHLVYDRSEKARVAGDKLVKQIQNKPIEHISHISRLASEKMPRIGQKDMNSLRHSKSVHK